MMMMMVHDQVYDQNGQQTDNVVDNRAYSSISPSLNSPGPEFYFCPMIVVEYISLIRSHISIVRSHSFLLHYMFRYKFICVPFVPLHLHILSIEHFFFISFGESGN